MAEQTNTLVPARYIGNHVAQLQGGLFFNIDGSRRKSLLLERGDTLMMPAREIIGFSQLLDPHQVQDPLDLGPGKRVLPEHKNLPDEALDALGYVFHQGRPDFELIEASQPADKAKQEQPAQAPPVAQEAPAQPAQQSDPLTVLSHLSKEG